MEAIFKHILASEESNETKATMLSLAFWISKKYELLELKQNEKSTGHAVAASSIQDQKHFVSSGSASLGREALSKYRQAQLKSQDEKTDLLKITTTDYQWEGSIPIAAIESTDELRKFDGQHPSPHAPPIKENEAFLASEESKSRRELFRAARLADTESNAKRMQSGQGSFARSGLPGEVISSEVVDISATNHINDVLKASGIDHEVLKEKHDSALKQEITVLSGSYTDSVGDEDIVEGMAGYSPELWKEVNKVILDPQNLQSSLEELQNMQESKIPEAQVKATTAMKEGNGMFARSHAHSSQKQASLKQSEEKRADAEKALTELHHVLEVLPESCIEETWETSPFVEAQCAKWEAAVETIKEVAPLAPDASPAEVLQHSAEEAKVELPAPSHLNSFEITFADQKENERQEEDLSEMEKRVVELVSVIDAACKTHLGEPLAAEHVVNPVFAPFFDKVKEEVLAKVNSFKLPPAKLENFKLFLFADRPGLGEIFDFLKLDYVSNQDQVTKRAEREDKLRNEVNDPDVKRLLNKFSDEQEKAKAAIEPGGNAKFHRAYVTKEQLVQIAEDHDQTLAYGLRPTELISIDKIKEFLVKYEMPISWDWSTCIVCNLSKEQYELCKKAGINIELYYNDKLSSGPAYIERKNS